MTTHVLTDDMRETGNRTATLHPRAPMTLEASGLTLDLVIQLLLKLLHYSGELSGIEIAQRLGLEFPVVEPAIDFIKRLHQCEIVGGAGIGGPSYRYRITDAGRQRAMLFMESSQYVGVAPVPLTQYVAYLEAYRAAMPRAITRSRVREAFSHLVLSERVLDQVGPAIGAAHSMFVYGPPGNGKTVIAQAIRNLLEGELAVPHALEVEGSIIRLFDPVNHEPLATEDDSGNLSLIDRPDARWVRCRRPMVMVGGELTLESLELCVLHDDRLLQRTDSGGRERRRAGHRRLRPAAMLGARSAEPLDCAAREPRRLPDTEHRPEVRAAVPAAGGVRHQHPAAELVDEAFLRRIHYKVFCESPTIADFKHIFQSAAPRAASPTTRPSSITC